MIYNDKRTKLEDKVEIFYLISGSIEPQIFTFAHDQYLKFPRT